MAAVRVLTACAASQALHPLRRAPRKPLKLISRPLQGDITLKLFPDECPRTVENFTTHARNGYFDNLIFHRCWRQGHQSLCVAA